MVYIVYNPKAGKKSEEASLSVEKRFEGKETKRLTVLEAGNYGEMLKKCAPDDEIVLVGGDGTVNLFMQMTRGLDYVQKIWLYKCGTGNDFLRDLCDKEADDGMIVEMNEYLKNPPVVTVKGKEYLFLNNVGFGIDGQVCTKAEEQMAKGNTDIDYTKLAIGCLLKSFHPADVEVTVDGKTETFKKVWLAPAMNGRYYGGGMKISPEQDRKGDTISVVLFHGSGRIRTLMIFPKIFKGEHVKYTKNITILKGHDIHVKYAIPQDVQIDGELIRDCTEYTAHKA